MVSVWNIVEPDAFHGSAVPFQVLDHLLRRQRAIALGQIPQD